MFAAVVCLLTVAPGPTREEILEEMEFLMNRFQLNANITPEIATPLKKKVQTARVQLRSDDLEGAAKTMMELRRDIVAHTSGSG